MLCWCRTSHTRFARLILEQTGRAEVFVSTFSTSEAFLNGIINLRKKKLIDHAALVVDIKASQKTTHLNKLMNSAFDLVKLTLNHSKILLVYTPSIKVTVITSQIKPTEIELNVH